VSTGETVREVYSDNDFNLQADCSKCGEPVQRTDGERSIHPVFAAGSVDDNDDFSDDETVTLCSDCVEQEDVEDCVNQARSLAHDPEKLRHMYQVIGTPQEQDTIQAVVRAVLPSPEV